MQWKVESLEFVQGVNLKFIDWWKKNGLKYFLIFDDS